MQPTGFSPCRKKNPDGPDEKPARSLADPEADRDRSVVVEKHAKADPEDTCQVGAPLPGLLAVRAEGEIFYAGERLCVIEAMKMESSVTAPIGGRIKKIHVPAREQIDAGDLLYTIVPA